MKPDLGGIARRAVPRFSDACLIDLLNVERTRLTRALTFPNKAFGSRRSIELAWDVSDAPAPLAQALQSGRPSIHATIPLAAFTGAGQSSQGVGAAQLSAVVAPIVTAGGLVGVASYLRQPDRPAYGRSDLVQATGLATQIAWLVESQRSADKIEGILRGQNLLLSSIAHDLRAPLSAIKLRAALLRRAAAVGSSGEQRVLAGLIEIDKSVKRANQLIDELLDFSRASNGQPLTLACEADDMVRLAREVINEHEPDGDGVKIALESAAAEVSGVWDTRRISRVLDRLIDRAVAACSRDGSVRVSVSKVRSRSVPCVAVSIQYRGPAGQADNLARTLAHDWMEESGAPRDGGLDLLSARHVVRAHRGDLRAESAPGGETRITIRLPLPGPSP